MARSRRSPPRQRTSEEREAAYRERQARRARRAAAAVPREALAPPEADVPPEPPIAAGGAPPTGTAPADRAAARADAAAAGVPPATAAAGAAAPRGRSRVARNTAIFSIATGLSRVMGLVREIVARSYFGTTGAASAFTLAFQVPNLVRALVADAALTSAFVPVFSDLLENKRRREAIQLATGLAGLILCALGALTLIFIAVAPWLMPLFAGDTFTPALDDLLVGLSRVLFPIVVLLGLTGLVVGILNAYDHFTIPALAPLVWNLVIIACLVVLTPLFEGDDRLYAYAIGVVAGTTVQLLMCLPPLHRLGFPLRISFSFRHPRIKQVLTLMLSVSVGLGLINIDVLLNSVIGSLVSDEVPSAIDAAFRIYMLPQGMFSVAVATVLFPALARLASRRDLPGLRRTTGTGMRQIALLLIPSAAATIALATPIVRLLYQRGEFDAESTRLTSEALFYFAFSLPFSGINLLLTRTFFALQRPWLPTALALGSLVVNVAVSLALYGSMGIGGVVLGTTVGNAAMTVLLMIRLRATLEGLEIARTLRAAAVMLAAAALLAGVSYGIWWLLDDLLGRSLLAQIISVGTGLVAGGAVYAAVVLAAGLPEAREIVALFRRRFGRA
jgi:putative peptidoglycan lipid II flippase